MAPSHDEERRGSATIASLKDAAGGQVDFHAEEPALKSEDSSGEELHVSVYFGDTRRSRCVLHAVVVGLRASPFDIELR